METKHQNNDDSPDPCEIINKSHENQTKINVLKPILSNVFDKIISESDNISQCVFERIDPLKTSLIISSELTDKQNQYLIEFKENVHISARNHIDRFNHKQSNFLNNTTIDPKSTITSIISKLHELCEIMSKSSPDVSMMDMQLKKLENEYRGIFASVLSLREKAKERSKTNYMENRLEEEQRREEKKWEEEWERLQNAIQEMEDNKISINIQIEELDSLINEIKLSNQGKSKQLVIQQEIQELEILLSLRNEEKRDILAATESLLKQKESTYLEEMKQSNGIDTMDKDCIILRKKIEEKELKLKSLQEIYKRLKEEILSNEDKIKFIMEKDERFLSMNNDMKELKNRLDVGKENQQQLLCKINNLKQSLSRAVMLKAACGNSMGLALQILEKNNGEMPISAFKKDLSVALDKHLNSSSSVAGVVKIMYGLVANGLIHIDRSEGEGIVFSLII